MERLRYWLSAAINSYSYLNAFNDYFLDYYLRHHKIIGWHKGLPVYSAFLTPGLSKPLANTLSRRLMSNLIQQPLPGMVNVAVTDICNAKCEHCSFYSAMDKPGEKVLTNEQMKTVIRSCQDFGISIINIVGGEPLLRKDLPDIIASIDKDRSSSCVYTNGWLLEQRCKELKKAGVMMVIVSLDSTNAATHDKFRKMPGLFEKAIKGIKASQNAGLLTAISTTLVQDDLENGNFEKMIEFAKKMRVNEVIVYDTMPIGMYSHREDLKKRGIDKAMLFGIVDKFKSRKDYPGIFCYAHFRSVEVFGCSAGRNYFYISPYGEMHPCDFKSLSIGNVLKTPLPELWLKLTEAKARTTGRYMNACCDNSHGSCHDKTGDAK